MLHSLLAKINLITFRFHYHRTINIVVCMLWIKLCFISL